jgi:hypothetical protein
MEKKNCWMLFRLMAERGENVLWVCCCWVVIQFEEKKKICFGTGCFDFCWVLIFDHWWRKFREDLFGFGF